VTICGSGSHISVRFAGFSCVKLDTAADKTLNPSKQNNLDLINIRLQT
jgi:hypothetical protein